MRLGIRGKIIFISGAILFFVIVVNTISIYYLNAREYSITLQSKAFLWGHVLNAQLDRLLKLRIPLGDLEGFEEQCKELVNNNEDIDYAMVLNPDGKILFHNDTTQIGRVLHNPSILTALASRKDVIQTSFNNKAQFYDVMIPVFGFYGEHVGATRVGFPSELIYRKTRKLFVTSLMVAIFFLAVFTTIMLFSVNRWVVKPIDNLIAVIRYADQKDLDSIQPVQINSKDEIGELGNTYNKMIIDLKKFHEEAKNYTSHLEQSIRDRTRDLKEINKRLIISLNNKDILLKEIYHRAKNNLQMVLSLIRHQGRLSENEQQIQLVKDTENRILSIALIHDHFYESKNLSRINANTYIRSLVNDIHSLSGRDHPGTSFHMEIENISLGIETAVPFGLIFNELVSNSLKHAFPEGRKGEVAVIFNEMNPSESDRHSAEKEYELIVRDNGIGLPANLDINTSNSLGFQLVAGLVLNQLKGTVQIKRTGGTQFVIRFKDSKYPGRI